MRSFEILLIFSFMPALLTQTPHYDHHNRHLDIQPDSLNPLDRFQTTEPTTKEDGHIHHHNPHAWSSYFDDYETDYESVYHDSVNHGPRFEATAPTTETPVPATKTCNKDEWQCADKSCIPSHFLCDFGPDCNDESDETNCEDEYSKRDKFMSAASMASTLKWMLPFITYCLMSLALYTVL